MINVKNIFTLVGRRVVNQDGQLGTIVAIGDSDHFPIVVTPDAKPERETYTKNGLFDWYSDDRYISLIEEPTDISDIDTDIVQTMSKYKLTPEELIAIVLERHCE